MTIKELMEKLKGYDENTRVIIDGHDGGCEDIKAITLQTIVLGTEKTWSGTHEVITKNDKTIGKNITTALWLSEGWLSK